MSRNTGNGFAVMNGNSNRLASAMLSILLYTQVGLCLVAVTFAILKDETEARPLTVAAVQTLDQQSVN
jgi:hypothetical protein